MPALEVEDELGDQERDTGPFCRHYSDPSECDVACAGCGHRCADHRMGTDTECFAETDEDTECDCPGWEEPD